LTLAGCGGGGGDDGPVVGDLAVTVVNQDSVARGGMVALQAGVLGGGGGGVAMSGDAASRLLAVSRKRIAAVLPPDVQACTYAGSTTTLLDDRDNSGSATIGDVATITYSGCSDVPGEVTNGSMTVSFTSAQLSTLPAVIGGSVSSLDLTTQTATASVNVQGGFDLLLRIDSATTGSMRVSVPNALTLAISTPVYTDTVTLRAGYLLESAYDDAALPPGGAAVSGRTTTTARGGVASAVAGGYVQVNTLQPFVQYNVDPYPRSGRFEALGKTGALQATVLSTSQVQLDLDADGNGVFEASKTVDWADFF
jgi:hypothetical protein